MRGMNCLSFVALLSTGSFASSVRAQTPFLLDGNTSGTSAPGVASSCLPHEVVDSSGNVHVVWQDFRSGEWAVFYRKGSSLGNSWGSEMQISASGAGQHALQPVIATDGTDLVVAWRTIPSGPVTKPDENVYAAVVNGATGAFTTTKMNSSTSTDYVGAPVVAANPGGYFYVGWTQAVTLPTGVDVDNAYLRGYASPTWSAAAVLSSPTNLRRARRLQIAAGGVSGSVKRVFAVFNRSTTNTTNPEEVDFVASANNGASFTAYKVLNSGLSSSTPEQTTIAANSSGIVQVIWTDSSAGAGPWVLESERSVNYGNNWPSTPTRVDNPSVNRDLAYFSSAVVDSAGNTYCTFVGTASFVGNVFETAMAAPPNATWSAETQVSSVTQSLPEYPLMKPKLAMASGGGATGVAITWTQRADGNDNYAKVWIATTKTGTTWSASQVDTSPITSPRQDYTDVSVRFVGGTTFAAAIVWDDRKNWTLGGTAPTGSGAPESYFLPKSF